jgi:hypothetical protein
VTADDGEVDDLPRGLLASRPLRSRVWTDPEGTAVCLVSPREPTDDGADEAWLYAEGDAFVDAAAHH